MTRLPLIAAAAAAAALACAGCSANPDDGQDRIWEDEALEEGDAPTPGAPADRSDRVTMIAGEYRVAGVDGAEVDLPHAITLSIDDATIRFVSDCVTGTWRYAFEGDLLATRGVSEEACERAPYPAEEGLQAAFDAGGSFVRTPANALLFTGGRHTVTLFSQ
ncbi:hypothetical protein [Aurantiacibacter spongiae]|uniref:META domain-containing protein n=1 Tax=Aurantiacibacter spongiae TaxID=2488860 RepID=A0A3N5CUS5_9SPHN|nr:hypothetical protein [Aurantiacibacter spongiae]RPF71200.1 hypothetical protein EG799_05930 [Aurantiacibacter spongiae]